eukprot:1546765-Rhodomonas_salina.1
MRPRTALALRRRIGGVTQPHVRPGSPIRSSSVLDTRRRVAEFWHAVSQYRTPHSTRVGTYLPPPHASYDLSRPLLCEPLLVQTGLSLSTRRAASGRP